MAKMFGTNGVRGVANEYMNCELALRMGRSIGAVLGNRIAVASDPRTSSPMLKNCVLSGLMSVGVDVIDLGVLPTPALQYFVKTRDEVQGGVMITASHNPPQFNGIKCIASDGTECAKEQEDRIEEIYDEDVGTAEWNVIGSCENYPGAVEEYLDAIIASTDVDSIRRLSPKVVLDCANGCACVTSPLLLQKLGVEFEVINGTPDMRCPGHESEPIESNLQELIARMKETGADLGAAHDGDADRVVFVTSTGRYVSGDLSLAILGKGMLSKEGEKVVTTVATSMVVEDTVKAAGGEVVYTAVGSPVVARGMISCGAVFGGEENGGLIFADHQFCRDGAKGLAAMLECIARNGPLEEQVESLPKYRTIKNAVYCPEDMKEKAVEVISGNHSGEAMDRTDGLRINYEDGWVLLRPSGTEPKFRIYSESRDPEIAERRSSEFVKEFEDLIN